MTIASADGNERAARATSDASEIICLADMAGRTWCVSRGEDRGGNESKDRKTVSKG